MGELQRIQAESIDIDQARKRIHRRNDRIKQDSQAISGRSADLESTIKELKADVRSGTYTTGDDFLDLAVAHSEARTIRNAEALRELADRNHAALEAVAASGFYFGPREQWQQGRDVAYVLEPPGYQLAHGDVRFAVRDGVLIDKKSVFRDRPWDVLTTVDNAIPAGPLITSDGMHGGPTFEALDKRPLTARRVRESLGILVPPKIELAAQHEYHALATLGIQMIDTSFQRLYAASEKVRAIEARIAQIDAKKDRTQLPTIRPELPDADELVDAVFLRLHHAEDFRNRRGLEAEVMRALGDAHTIGLFGYRNQVSIPQRLGKDVVYVPADYLAGVVQVLEIHQSELVAR